MSRPKAGLDAVPALCAAALDAKTMESRVSARSQAARRMIVFDSTRSRPPGRELLGRG